MMAQIVKTNTLPSYQSSSSVYQPKSHQPKTNSENVPQLQHQIRVLEAENKRLMTSQRQLVMETNRKINLHTGEIQMLKHERAKVQKEAEELRELCCFLDDDRQRTKRLSREWQRFGRYTSDVMRQEVAGYQEKLSQLEDLQKNIISENSELKQLCLFLDEQRTQSRQSVFERCSSCGAEVSDQSKPNQDHAKRTHNQFGTLSPDNLRDDIDNTSGRSSDSENTKPESDRNYRPFHSDNPPRISDNLPPPLNNKPESERDFRPFLLNKSPPFQSESTPSTESTTSLQSDTAPNFLDNIPPPPPPSVKVALVQRAKETKLPVLGDSPTDTLKRTKSERKPSRSVSFDSPPSRSTSPNEKGTDALLSYIKRLEARVQSLECHSQSGLQLSSSSPNILAENENRSQNSENEHQNQNTDLTTSQQSTGSYGTSVTYGSSSSSGSDSPITAVYVSDSPDLDYQPSRDLNQDIKSINLDLNYPNKDHTSLNNHRNSQQDNNNRDFSVKQRAKSNFSKGLKVRLRRSINDDEDLGLDQTLYEDLNRDLNQVLNSYPERCSESHTSRGPSERLTQLLNERLNRNLNSDRPSKSEPELDLHSDSDLNEFLSANLKERLTGCRNSRQQLNDSFRESLSGRTLTQDKSIKQEKFDFDAECTNGTPLPPIEECEESSVKDENVESEMQESFRNLVQTRHLSTSAPNVFIPKAKSGDVASDSDDSEEDKTKNYFSRHNSLTVSELNRLRLNFTNRRRSRPLSKAMEILEFQETLNTMVETSGNRREKVVAQKLCQAKYTSMHNENGRLMDKAFRMAWRQVDDEASSELSDDSQNKDTPRTAF